MGYLYGLWIPDVSVVSKLYPAVLMFATVIPSIVNASLSDPGFEKPFSAVFCLLGPGQPTLYAVYTYFWTVNDGYVSADYQNQIPFQNYWVYIIGQFILGTLSFLLTIYWENKKYSLVANKTDVKDEVYEPDQTVEEDVEQEQKRVALSGNSDLIQVSNLEKIYPNGFKALNSITFGVEQGQILGLLGPNGAGKSTTFNIVTAVLPKSRGSAQLLGEEINQGMYNVFDQVGLCPQVNPLWGDLSVIDHLWIYGHMKGIDDVDIKSLIDYFLKALELSPFANTKASGLSGGNKRKLCVAMCLMGAPRLQFLDEPSTGVDPVARKYLWNCLKESMKGRNGAMILTTHYMQEAESLANKLAIIINGRLSSVGTLTDLSRRYGQYTIMINEEEGKSAEIDNLVLEFLPEAKKVKSTGENARSYRVAPENMKFALAFAKLEEAKTQKIISDFSIFTSTLDQIFLKLSKYQRSSTL